MNKKKEMQRIYLAMKQDGCILCKVLKQTQKTQTEIHHLRSGQGMSQRGVKCIPLCVEHHRGDTGFHGLGRKGFEQLHNISENELLQACSCFCQRKRSRFLCCCCWLVCYRPLDFRLGAATFMHTSGPFGCPVQRLLTAATH